MLLIIYLVIQRIILMKNKHVFIREYKKSPYSLEQNIAEVLLDL
jgi:hypothetical protein